MMNEVAARRTLNTLADAKKKLNYSLAKAYKEFNYTTSDLYVDLNGDYILPMESSSPYKMSSTLLVSSHLLRDIVEATGAELPIVINGITITDKVEG